MEIIEYFSSSNKVYWLSKIKESDWDAAQYLHELLKNDKLKELVGESTRVFLLTDVDELVSFCTLAELDDVQPTSLTPWVGWIYTFPHFRGHRCAGELLSFAENIAFSDGYSALYISTNHTGLYEKYGYEFFRVMKDISGEDTRVYVKHL